MKVLILGGTTEGSELARALALAGNARWEAVVSLAGRTRRPAPSPLPCRVGGFGGVEGLARYLREHRVEAVVDATHPFAEQMTRNTVEAARLVGVRLLRVSRPAWRKGAGDRWTEVASMAQAAVALGLMRRRVLLTVGQKELGPFIEAPWHDYLVRSVDPPALLPDGARLIVARGPFGEAEERALLGRERIEILVTKNSGGEATRAKLMVARALGVEVVMVARPAAVEGVAEVGTSAEALAWLERHAALRGE
jgi:precorrin-6A/cobalt-precorrin-6A reductase